MPYIQICIPCLLNSKTCWDIQRICRQTCHSHCHSFAEGCPARCDRLESETCYRRRRFPVKDNLATFIRVVSHSSMSRGEPFFTLCSSWRYFFKACKHLHVKGKVLGFKEKRWFDLTCCYFPPLSRNIWSPLFQCPPLLDTWKSKVLKK